MRRLIFALPLLFVAACSAFADDSDSEPAASGVSGSRNFAASGFDSVSLQGPDKVIVRVGGAESVVAEGDTGVLDRLKIEVVDGTLKVGRIKRDGMNFDWGNDSGSATVTVTLPAIKAAALAGSGDMEIDAVTGASFKGSIAGSGEMRVAAIKVDEVNFSIAGSGDARMAGTAKAVKYSIAGSGDVDAGALAATDANISMAGSGNVKAGASGAAKVSIVGSGDVEIVGGAACTVSKMGSGDVRCTPAQAAAPVPPEVPAG